MEIGNFALKRIMIVDDSKSMRQDLIRIMSSLGFKNIVEMENGKEAWDRLRLEAQYKNPFEVIITDINMPVMNGIMLLKNLRGITSYSNTPIFIVSTETELSIVLKAIHEGASDYILKPYDEVLVKHKILSFLAKV
jgi:two-component system chemotaxis response regulator CheY